MKVFAVVRIRGRVDVPPDVKTTLKLLRLHKKFHATLVDDKPSYIGMLRKVQDYVTWGEINYATLALLLRRRGRLEGGAKLTDDYVKKYGFSSIEEFAKAIVEGKAKITDIPKLKPIFRLSPPSGGFKGTIKRHYKDGGELGYRGEAINELIERMA